MLTCVAGGPAGLADALREVLEHDFLLADAGVSEALAQALASAPGTEAALDAACSGRMPGLYQLLSHTDLDRRAAVRFPCCCSECYFILNCSCLNPPEVCSFRSCGDRAGHCAGTGEPESQVAR